MSTFAFILLLAALPSLLFAWTYSGPCTNGTKCATGLLCHAGTCFEPHPTDRKEPCVKEQCSRRQVCMEDICYLRLANMSSSNFESGCIENHNCTGSGSAAAVAPHSAFASFVVFIATTSLFSVSP